jgi:mannose-6-phosphate isomerase-like protein (cupin superfamily)
MWRPANFVRADEYRDKIHAMKLPAAALLALAGALVIPAAVSDAVTFVSHDKVAAALAKGGPLVTASNLIIQGGHRDKAGQVEVHEKETDVIYVQDGEATFVTGGKMIDGKPTRPGQYLGREIQGGESHHLVKGDVIVVPAGTPHWFKEVPGTVSYFVVKVLK